MSMLLIWEALGKQAKAWAATPVFTRFAAQLPDRERSRKAAVPALLAELEAGGARVVGQPLRVHNILPRMLAAMEIEQDRIDDEFVLWSRDAERVWQAHRDTVAWVRSRLPGYPKFFAPQLTPDTTYTTSDFSYDFTWAAGERSRGLAFEPAPPRTATSLGADDSQRADLERTAQLVGEALRASDQWNRLDRATVQLDDTAHEDLRAARKELLARLAPQRVDAHEPRLSVRRDAYRRAVIAEETAKLSGLAREYSDAFEQANELIVEVTSDVFGQLAAYGQPTVVPNHSQVELESVPVPRVAFSSSSQHIFNSGELIRLVDPLVPDVLRILSMTISFDRGRLSQRIEANILTESATAWSC